MLVQTEAIITQLVFEHALRIRVKAETSKTSSPSSSVATTPDNASLADTNEASSEVNGSEDETDAHTAVSEGTNASKVKKTKAPSTSGDSSTTQASAAPASDEKGGNLVGKLNNLVTTDLNNMVDGRDFLFVSK